MPNETIREWSELEDAVARQDWAEASMLAGEFEQEWKTVRGFAESVAGPGAGGWSQVIDEALEALTAALSIRPVPKAAVEKAMQKMREILGEYAPKSDVTSDDRGGVDG